jgi:hypothetical protein
MPTIKSFDDLDAFFAQEAQARQQADGNVHTQQILQPGDFFVRQFSGLTIYGEILDAATHLLQGRSVVDLEDEELEEYNDTMDTYQAEHMRFYRFTRSFSQVCPRGELGDIHLSTVTRKITAEEFQAAKAAGWP